MDLLKPEKGHIGWVRTDKDRPAVVVKDLGNGTFIVATGTGTDRGPPCVQIGERERAGRILGLSKRTYFYPTNFPVVRADEIRVKGRCKESIVFGLEKLVDLNSQHIPAKPTTPPRSCPPKPVSAQVLATQQGLPHPPPLHNGQGSSGEPESNTYFFVRFYGFQFLGGIQPLALA